MKTAFLKWKYRLGGIVLAVSAFFNALSCDKPAGQNNQDETAPDDNKDNTGDEIMCYDPAPQNEVEFLINSEDHQSAMPGQTITVMIYSPTYKEFYVVIYPMEDHDNILQKEVLKVEDTAYAEFEITLSKEITFTGEAVILSYVMEEKGQMPVGAHPFTIKECPASE